ncbi:CAP domain-containing protein [bacterium]|nr:CAP domain-containing protein [bacterium]MBU1958239.1 CAP domain-containing protein [bacterium]
MKKNKRTFLLGLVALFSVYLYTLSATTIPNQILIKDAPTIDSKKEEQAALDYLNRLRTGAGLIEFSSNTLLKNAAKNHADYLTQHNTFGHFEENNKGGFTGTYASDRILHAGYATPLVIENVSSNNRNYKESIDGLFSAIYHRMAFLDFQSDEIGIGITQNPNDTFKTSFVYNMSAQALAQLYKEKNATHPKSIQIPKKVLNKALTVHKNRNAKIVTYPFTNQHDVPPAFFDELPDPLPLHRVSGFPISVGLNQAHFKHVKLLKFELFNSDGLVIKDTLIYDHKSDPHQRLNTLDYVLFPLKRLDWNRQYHVKFSALVDNKKIEKKWSFHTTNFTIPLHHVHNSHQTFTIKKNQSQVFYFPPQSKIDLLGDLKFPSDFDIDFIDKNTIKLTALQAISVPVTLNIGQHKLKLHIQP